MVPRTEPREEQLVRASRAAELGLVAMLMHDRSADPAIMAAALRGLAGRSPPSAVLADGWLDGLDFISRRIGAVPVADPRNHPPAAEPAVRG